MFEFFDIKFILFLQFLLSFSIVSLASKQVGSFFSKYKLPLITGFLFTGIIAGPYFLNICTSDVLKNINFIEKLSLSFIALSAGSEIFYKEIKSKIKTISIISFSILFFTLVICGIISYFALNLLPFTKTLSFENKFVISILVGTVLGAISPSSSIAVIKELKAKGPYTSLVLGVTILMDIMVITLFTINTSLGESILLGHNFDLLLIVKIFVDLISSIIIGLVFGYFLSLFFLLKIKKDIIKFLLILLFGYLIFALSLFIKKHSFIYLNLEIHFEPLLACIISGFYVSNFTVHRRELARIIKSKGLTIYIIFFTLVGSSLEINIFKDIWKITLLLFTARLFSMFFASFTGAIIRKENMKMSSLLFLGFISQAGISLGLAKEASSIFPLWGVHFSTLIISIIIINQLLGPIFFKLGIHFFREHHIKEGIDNNRNCIIFGADGQALALARLLKSHKWNPVIVIKDKLRHSELLNLEITVIELSEFSEKAFNLIGLASSKAVVTMLSDEDNYSICEIIYKSFRKTNMVVFLNNKENNINFEEFDAKIVEPSTSTINLLDHFVRYPLTTSIFLGLEGKQDFADIEIGTCEYCGIALRDLRLPLDVQVLTVHRNGNLLIVNGDLILELGDLVSLVGSFDSLQEVSLMFKSLVS